MVKVKLFANFREIAGKKEVDVEAVDLNSLLKILAAKYPKFSELYNYAIVMVNGKVAKENVKLRKDDVVAILPPVSGG